MASQLSTTSPLLAPRDAAAARPAGRPAPVRRGPGGVRNANVRRQRVQISDDENSDADNVSEHENEDGEQGTSKPDFSGEKIGAKKRAKLEAKSEKKMQRESEMKAREDKKKKDAIVEEERKKVEEKELEEQRRQEEIERMAREEAERREHEEYLKMKAAFAVEEEGFDEETEAEKENLLQEFITYIRNNKVVVLEDLAQHFKLKTQAVIDRINDLKSNGTLTGVVDDRGKFIYVSEIELQSVAKFIKQRGRVSISELAESSNSLINLVPVKS